MTNPSNEPGLRLGKMLDEAVAASSRTRSFLDPVVITPPVDVKVTSAEVVVFVDLPGLDEDNINIEMRGTDLAISAQRDFDHDQEDAEEFARLERPYGQYQLNLSLPGPVDFAHVTAKYKRGVLKVRMPKSRHWRSLGLEGG